MPSQGGVFTLRGSQTLLRRGWLLLPITSHLLYTHSYQSEKYKMREVAFYSPSPICCALGLLPLGSNWCVHLFYTRAGDENENYTGVVV